MNSPTPLIERSGQHSILQSSADATRQLAAPFTEAANDGEFYRNPMWAVAFALALLLALLACLVASG